MASETVCENPDVLTVRSDALGVPDHTVSPLEFLSRDDAGQGKPGEAEETALALLILNQKINLPFTLFVKVWNSATVKVCADGGINRLRDYVHANADLAAAAAAATGSSFYPDFVIGDLDSATEENLRYYTQHGTVLVKQESQYYTDLTKSVTLINAWFNHRELIVNLSNINTVDGLETKEQELHGLKTESINININILVLGGVGGRFDQTMSVVNHIWNYNISRPHLNFLILNPEHTEMIILLKPGINFINYERFDKEKELHILGFNPVKSRPQLRNVGVLPLLNEAVITTRGLKWDVENWSTSIKSKMSSSNLQVGNKGFIIKTDAHIFIALEL